MFEPFLDKKSYGNKLEVMKTKVIDFLHILILLLSIFLIVEITIDTFQNVSFIMEPSYLKIQFWICIIFLLDYFIELFLSSRKVHYMLTNIPFLLVAIPYSNILDYYSISLSLEASYFLRFIPLIRGGYAISVVVSWLSSSKVTGLFTSYITLLLSIVYFCSLIFFVLEHSVNSMVATYGDALWWAFMNVTTVGSNIYAVTATGKVMSVVLAGLGMMLFPIFTVYITQLVQKKKDKS